MLPSKTEILILTAEPFDKKRAKIARPDLDTLHRFIEELERVVVLSSDNRVWRPVGIVFERTDRYTFETAGFYPPNQLQGTDIYQFVRERAIQRQQREQALSAPQRPEPVPVPEPDGEAQSSTKRKIIIKKQGERNETKGNSAKT